MFHREQMTPALEAELIKNRVPLARSMNELEAAHKAGKVDAYALSAGSRVTLLLSDWNGAFTPSWEGLEGLKVLDIGSGSNYSHSAEPYLSRIFAFNGAEVTAIDRNKQTGMDTKLFTGIKADIARLAMRGTLGQLPLLQGQKFDIIQSVNFVGANADTSMFEAIDRRNRRYGRLRDFFERDVENAMVGQLLPFLAEGGFLDFDMFRYMKRHYYMKINGVYRHFENPKVTDYPAELEQIASLLR